MFFFQYRGKAQHFIVVPPLGESLSSPRFHLKMRHIPQLKLGFQSWNPEGLELIVD